ncbi:glycosyltransferase family 39 protein [Candidatus Gottesmanbacteria bacterium]|nr:glycosyltransferase family 39 protein [Candidatus Gottesmanbacteria bacterium]
MNNKRFLLGMIFLLGLILRFWNLKEAPPGLNRDEASIGYTAYSLLKTGKDEYGKSWPISFKSFGDWKLPLYIYVDIPFINSLGMTDISVRLPSAIFGSLTVFIVYFLSKELFKKAEHLPLLSAFLFSFSPWSIHLSRTASEANVAVFFTALGFLFYLRTSNIWNQLLGTILLSLSLYTYHANHIFTPLLFAGLVFFAWRKNRYLKTHLIPIFIFCVLSFFIYSQTLFSADKTKISGLFPVSDPSLVYEKVITDRLQHVKSPIFLSNLLHNKLLFITMSTLQNYIKSFSPEFLFITGGGNDQHNIPDFGNLYLWEAPFLILGFSYFLIMRSENKNIMLWWILISPIAASMTKDAPHTARMASIIPLFEILIAIGILKSIDNLKRRENYFLRMFIPIATFLFFINCIIWADRYFIHFPLKRVSEWGEGYSKLLTYLKENNNFVAKEIVMSRPEYSPYIYFLFYNSVDPSYYQNAAVRYPETEEGFQHVAKFDNYSFRQIDWTGDLAIPDRLYIEWSEQIPKSATNSSTLITKEVMMQLIKDNKNLSNLKIGDIIISEKIGDIKLQNNKFMFSLIKTSKQNEKN